MCFQSVFSLNGLADYLAFMSLMWDMCRNFAPEKGRGAKYGCKQWLKIILATPGSDYIKTNTNIHTVITVNTPQKPLLLIVFCFYWIL